MTEPEPGTGLDRNRWSRAEDRIRTERGVEGNDDAEKQTGFEDRTEDE